jgi:hypothetical protein
MGSKKKGGSWSPTPEKSRGHGMWSLGQTFFSLFFPSYLFKFNISLLNNYFILKT